MRVYNEYKYYNTNTSRHLKKLIEAFSILKVRQIT